LIPELLEHEEPEDQTHEDGHDHITAVDDHIVVAQFIEVGD
jgi:hypothetical protein